MPFAKRLKELREETKMTQFELSVQLNLSPSAIGLLEQGRRKPSLETLEAICDHFNVDMDYMLGKSNIRNRDKESIVLQGQKKSSRVLAAFATEDLTEEEIEEVLRFIEFVKGKRND